MIETDPRVTPKWGRRITPEQQARATTMAEAWVEGQTLAQIGEVHGVNASRVRQIIVHAGLYEWVCRERRGQ